MEYLLKFDTDYNQSQPPQDRVIKLADLIFGAKGSQVVPSDPDNAMGIP